MNLAVAATRSDAFLITRAKQGDQRAFEQLYRDHVGRVYGLCLRLKRDVASAEDCTQQTFINAWHALPRFEDRSSFATWLHRIAVNVALASQRRSADSMDAPLVELDEEAAPLIFDTPVEQAELEAAIQSLPEGARNVLVLSGIYGYSHSEVAGMLGIAEGTCKAQLHRARVLLKQMLQLDGG
jgi:RNA polymerase sigma-70 factor, ECF subfamily